MADMRKMPGLFDPEGHGLGDPTKVTPEERQLDPDWLAESRERRRSMSPLVRKFQALTDKALGRKR